MSGPFGSSQWMYSSGGFYPYEIDQSLRFNDDDSAYLSRTPASVGTDRTTWTFSCWLKRGNITGTVQTLFSAGGTNDDYSWIRIDSDETLNVFNNIAGVSRCNLSTSAVFRDTSAWYHLVFNRNGSSGAKIYVNGVEQSVSGTNYSGTTIDLFADTIAGSIGRLQRTGTLHFDGYLAEVNFIDGQALDPTSFGEFKSGVWVAKDYTGSYGTNGFRLSFADSANIGDDTSGNTNDWTANNLVATDVVLDSPTNNFAVVSPIDKSSGATLSNGNLDIAAFANDWLAQTRATIGVSSGKWYWEVTSLSNGSFAKCGVRDNTAALTANGTSSTGSEFYFFNGNKQQGATDASYGSGTGSTSGYVVGVALDMDSGKIWWSVNGVWQASGDPAAGTNAAFENITGTQFPTTSSFNVALSSNFGQSSFAYTPPSGYLALCTANLPDPVIDPAQDDVPSDYFTTALYTGTGSTINLNTIGFQPDLTWIKGRNFAFDHGLFDSVRGGTKQLYSSLANSEFTWTNGITFDSEGVDISADSNLFNGSGFTYVGWNWLAGNGTSSNTDGSITSTVSVNQKAGFSVVSYAGNGVNGATAGHGLGVTPDMVILKNRNGTNAWRVYHSILGTSPTQTLYLNLTDGSTTDPNIITGVNSSTMSLGISAGNASVNGSGNNYIAYCFAEVEGYSKFGSYTGNGSTDGPFVYCGFRPAWVMVKRTDSTSNWYLWDDRRFGYNVANKPLFPNLSDAEDTGATNLDLLSNGFKWRNSGTPYNASGGTYIFMAFAEMPAKYSLGR